MGPSDPPFLGKVYTSYKEKLHESSYPTYAPESLAIDLHLVCKAFVQLCNQCHVHRPQAQWGLQVFNEQE